VVAALMTATAWSFVVLDGRALAVVFLEACEDLADLRGAMNVMPGEVECPSDE